VKTSWRDRDRVREAAVTALGPGRWQVTVDGAAMELAVERMPDGRLRIACPQGVTVAEVTRVGDRRFVRLGTLEFVLDREAGTNRRRGESKSTLGALEAPMPGVVTRVMVVPGDDVEKGQPLLAL